MGHDNGRIFGVNSVAARLFGYDSSELIGMNVETLIASGPPTSRTDTSENIEKPIYKTIGSRKDGAKVSLEVTITTVYLAGRKIDTPDSNQQRAHGHAFDRYG